MSFTRRLAVHFVRDFSRDVVTQVGMDHRLLLQQQADLISLTISRAPPALEAQAPA